MAPEHVTSATLLIAASIETLCVDVQMEITVQLTRSIDCAEPAPLPSLCSSCWMRLCTSR
jgi:hypothetical protein